MAAATMVATSEEDPLLAVIRFCSEQELSDAGPDVAESMVSNLLREAQNLIVVGRWPELTSLMLTSADVVATRLGDKDFECVYTVICNLVPRATSPNEQLDMIESITLKVCQQPGDKPALRLKILFNLYNLLETPYHKFFVYKKALELATAGKVVDSIAPSFKTIDHFLGEWNVAKTDRRELFLSISKVLKDNKSMSKEHFIFLNKYLATFSESHEDLRAINDAKEEAAQAIIEFVRLPNLFQSDLLDMPAVIQLEKDGKLAPLYQLLKIFLTERLDAYMDFEAANASLLKNYGLVHEDCITKMRFMSLLDLGDHCSGEISYSAIKDTLRINDDEVEQWVVRAITAKILDCKIDQLNQIVLVSRHTRRVFGESEWEILRSKLAAWRANIASAISTIHSSKIVDESAQAVDAR